MANIRARTRRNGPNIADVARHAGVSPMTVSRVINGEAAVRPETRDKVNAAIAALDYTPSPAARQLAGGTETRIGLIHSNPSAGYLSELLMGCLDRASTLNLQLMVEKFDEGAAEADVVNHIVRSRVSGIVLPPPLCESPAMLAALADAGIPAVAVAAGLPRDEVPSIGIDDFEAARTMTGHLIALGHRRIGFIKGNPDQSASELRFSGYCAALVEAGLEQDAAIVAQGLFTYRSGLEAAARILDAPQRPTAIFASNDDMAAAAVAVAHARHIDVPAELTICGFDDTPLATTIWPELTTIRQPVREMARAAVDLLVDIVRGRPTARRTVLAHELVRRQSDAPPTA